MKKSLRIASAALALTLAASCAVPAFAAGSSSFSKDETVYAVMNGDGSLKSTTVSEHLYNAGGLSSVTDKSTLTDIQNTESSAEFTQNGDELVWNTDDTDVYYKGSTDKTLPMDVKVTYALDGQEAALEDLIGKSGHLTVTVSLKNNETGTVESINTRERSMVVRMDDRRLVYPAENLNELEIAYAITVHKSQGSEFPAVILPVAQVPPRLCYRNLFYTGVTRARKLCIVAGRRDVANRMMSNVRQNLRYSGLCALLQAELPPEQVGVDAAFAE